MLLHLVSDSMPSEVLRKLRAQYDSQIDEGIVLKNVPLIIDRIDKYVVTTNVDGIVEWGKSAARFLDAADVSRLFRTTSSAYLVTWTKHNGRAELSGVAGLLLKARQAIDDVIFDWDSGVKAGSDVKPELNDDA